MMKENSIIAFHYVFMITFYADTLQNISLSRKLKDFDFDFDTLSTLNIIYIKVILLKRFFGLHSNNETTKKKNYCEKFIEELGFLELSAEVKYLSGCVCDVDITRRPTK